MRRHLASAAVVLSLLALSAQLPAQEPAKSSGLVLKLSTKSAEARAAFYAGVDAAENILLPAAATQLKRALELDPKLAAARAYYGTYAPGLTAEQRSQELQLAAADAMSASLGELLLVLALRAPAGTERRSLLKAAAEAVPDDPHVLYLHATALADPRERARGLEEINRRFPEFAPAYNQLAYARARELADIKAGLTTVQRYLKLVPQNPNAHDSYGELLAWAGRLDEAAQHYQEALSLDAKYSAGHTGLAEIATLQANSAQARAHYEHAIPLAATPQARLNLRQSAAVAFIPSGNIKGALSELRAIAAEAESNGYTAVAAQAHRNLAVVEASLGNRTLVDSHVRKAETLGGANNNGQHALAAVAYAVAGDVAGARPHAKAFREAAAASSSQTFKRQAQGVTAIVEAAAGNADAAQTAAESAGVYNAYGLLLLAETLKKQGKQDAARDLAALVLANTELDILSIIARRRAKRI
jgi:hypothetical protein